MKKGLTRVIASFLAVIMIALIMPVADMGDIFGVNAYAATKNGDLGGKVTWSYNTDSKTLTISGSGNMSDSKSSSDKNDKFNVYLWDKVTHIYKHATKIIINSGITNIGANTFRNFSALETVQMPSTIKSINKSAFENCPKLKTINLPEGLTTIGDYAFKKTGFTSITAPYTLTSIGNYAFADVKGLTVNCNSGDAAYNYCKANNIKTNFRAPEVFVTSVFNDTTKQVTLEVKVKNASLFNAANFDLIYSKGLIPVSTETVVPKDGADNSLAIRYVGDTVKIGFMSNSEVGFANCKGQCEYTVCELLFNTDENYNYSNVTLKTIAFMNNSAKMSFKDISKKVMFHEHVEVVIPAKAATCTEAGSTAGKKCSICDEILVAVEVISPLGHSFDEGVVTAATCTEGGYITQTCSVCKATQKVDETPATGHKFEDKVTKVTCTQDGYTIRTCSVCKTTQKVDEIPATGHKFEDVVTPATCLKGGNTTQTCTACGLKNVTDITNPLGHDLDENGKCSRCDYVAVTKLAFKDSTGITVDEDKKIVLVKKTFNVSDFVANVEGDGWSITGAKGSESLATKDVLVNGNVSYTIIVLGDIDCNGKISATDARRVLRIATKLDKVDDMLLLAADADGNGKYTAVDARIVLRVATKLESFK